MHWHISSILCPRGGGGGITPILKLYGDVPPFRVWFYDRPLINRVSSILKRKWVEFDLKIINTVLTFQDFHELFIINRVRVSRSGRHHPCALMLKHQKLMNRCLEENLNNFFYSRCTFLEKKWKHGFQLNLISKQSCDILFNSTEALVSLKYFIL